MDAGELTGFNQETIGQPVTFEKMTVNAQKIDVYKVEVLDNDIQKYSSTTVSGGAGYVSTVNGTTMGQTEAIKSTVTHHVSQSIWVKDLHSGQERQLSLDDVQIPVRPGHWLWIAYDHESEQWERIINDSTGEYTYGNGYSNPDFAAKLRGKVKGSFLFAILLVVPLLNLLAGIMILRFLLETLVTLSNRKIPGIGSKLLKALALGIGLFLASYWALIATVVDPKNIGFLIKLVSIVTVIALMSMSSKVFKATHNAAAEVIDDRSKRIDAAIQQARAK